MICLIPRLFTWLHRKYGGEEVRGGAARKKVWYEPFVHAQI